MSLHIIDSQINTVKQQHSIWVMYNELVVHAVMILLFLFYGFKIKGRCSVTRTPVPYRRPRIQSHT